MNPKKADALIDKIVKTEEENAKLVG